MSVAPQGMLLRSNLDHFTLGRTWGGDGGVKIESAEREACRTSEIVGRDKLSWRADVLGPPQKIRFPFGVHLAADSET